jgi:hypothetical protein
MEPDAFDQFVERLFGAKKLMRIIGALALIAAGVAECWAVGHFELPRLLAIPGFMLIGVGIGICGLAILSEDNGYNF